ncbi:LysM peptidoglycan-binding domain-containing protein [Paenibacillus sp. ACRSA]|uniref:LysM peptidoglycan-binding domain-containing protein n=1 Tax=Paenibacillus sp. ACRSA TaxID=2918211 RepID=UPI001EF47FC4|nr:LysM peptidoglycan-binding domain-containing protein [Paenibacillus sp. ACRSA]
MKIHMVKKGDTLYLLSQKYNVALDKIIAANPQISDPDKLDIGMKVKIPAAPVTPKPEGVLHSHKVQQGDSLWKLSQAWGVPLKDMINANPQLKNPNALLVGETVHIPSMQVQGNTGTDIGASNVAAHEKLSPEGKEHTGVKEEPVTPEAPVPSSPPPTPVVPEPIKEQPAPTSKPANPVPPNVMPELEVLPQLPEIPDVKPTKEPEKKENLAPTAQVKPLPEAPKYTMPNLSPEIMPLPAIPNTKAPVEVSPATKSPCGCGSKLHHAPAEYPYTQVPVPAQEVYTAEQATYIAGHSNNAGFPGITDISPYEVQYLSSNNEPDFNHNNTMPNSAPVVANNAYPQAPSAQVNSPFPSFAAEHSMNQPPFISPYSVLPYPPCGCGGHTHAPNYGHVAPGYNDPAWGMYSPYGGHPNMAPSVVPYQPVEYAYQNPYPSQNMVPPSPLGAFGELYPSQEHTGGKKGGREEANLSQTNFESDDNYNNSGKAKQSAGKSGVAKRRTAKPAGKRTSKVSVSSKEAEARKTQTNKRSSAKSRRNPWIQQ